MNQTDILDQRFQTSEELVESRLGNETVMLHLSSGLYFGLDQISTEYWGQIKAGMPARKTCAAIAEMHGVPIEQVEDDARRFLRELIENKAVEIA